MNHQKSVQTSQSKSLESLFITLVSCFALLGFSLALRLTHHFYQVHNGTLGFHSFCNLSETLDCDRVSMSPYSEVLPGLPLSVVGAASSLALLILSLISHSKAWRKQAILASVLFSGFQTAVGIAYIFIMTNVIHSICLFCLGIDFCNLASFLLLIYLRTRSEFKTLAASSLSKSYQWICFAGATFASFVFIVGCSHFLWSRPVSEDVVENKVEEIFKTGSFPVEIDEHTPFLGPKDAPIQVLKFSDFECGFCGLTAFTFHSLMEKYHDQIRLAFKHFPLDSGCNSEIQNPFHLHACQAAQIAVCAAKQKRFKEVYEVFFMNQAQFDFKSPLFLAQQIPNLNAKDADFLACMKSEWTQEMISKDVRAASLLSVKSTPTLFINGYRIEGFVHFQIIDRFIQKLLKAQGIAPNFIQDQQKFVKSLFFE